MTIPASADEARRLLLAHADRAVTGPLDDPAVAAAVVGVERLVVATGTTDADTLLAALEGRPTGADDAVVQRLVGEAVRHVITGIMRRDTGQNLDAGVINPDAGTYRMTNDAVLLRAAVRAAQRSFDAMPYYEIRYGERGSRFASSDSAWLVSLAPLAADRAIYQVTWLAGVLAGRGMPAWLLETHVEELVREVRGVAGQAATGSLPAAAAALRDARCAHVDDDLLVQADAWADEALGRDRPVPRTGTLVATAVADVLAGIAPNDSALVDWLTDPQRLDTDGAQALLDVRERVRDAARD